MKFWKNDGRGFVIFWVRKTCGFWLGNEGSDSYCWNMSRGFEGLEDTTLSGPNNTNFRHPPYDRFARLVAVQLK